MSAAEKKRINPWTVPILMVVIALGLVVGWNYLVHLQLKQKEANMAGADARLPYLSRLEENIRLTEMSGEEIELRQLKYKVLVASYSFTRCPSGCAGIQAEIGELREIFSDYENLHFLSFSLDPEYDTPEVLRNFAEPHDFGGENWWFLTGEPKPLRNYMVHTIGFSAPVLKKPEEMLFEGDIYNHDMRIALIDHLGHVRGFYEVMHSQDPTIHRDRLRKDLKRLLDEAEDFVPPKGH